MKLVLPKSSRGMFFPQLLPIEMNEFDVERLLPSLFYLVVTGGSQRQGRRNSPTDLNSYVDQLARHNRMSGFDDAEGRRLLDRWLRTSVIRVSRVGQVRGTEQIEYVLPLTLLAYKTGLPAEISRQRGVHTFMYKVLFDALSAADARPSPVAALRALFTIAFGRGVRIDRGPTYEGEYDGQAELDLHSLLCLNYLDGFRATPAAIKDAVDPRSLTLPGAALDLAGDVLGYLAAYAGQMPPLALTQGLMALISAELFGYTRRLFYATNKLVETGSLSQVPPPLYVDFTRQRGGASDEMARASVERDLEEIRAFYESAMLLRTLHRFVEQRPDLRDRLGPLDTPTYLTELLKLREHPRIEARAEVELESIQEETLDACDSDADREEAQALFRALENRYPSATDRAAKLIAMAQERSGVQKHIHWYWSIAGLRKPFGLLTGSLRGRRDWRYVMSDDLLATLVHVAVLERRGTELGAVASQTRLGQFLSFLEDRFGIIVDRPPPFLDTAAGRAAAKANVAALRHRLRQMGFFEALSDDFGAQYLRVPQQGEVAA